MAWAWVTGSGEIIKNHLSRKVINVLRPSSDIMIEIPKARRILSWEQPAFFDYADDLENEIRRLDEKPILVGHSMGGLIAQILGSRGLASALVLLCPAAPAGISMFKWSIIKGSWRTMGQFAIWRKPFRPTFDEVVYSILNRIPVEQRRALYDKLGYESGRAMWEIACWFLDSKKTTKIDASKIIERLITSIFRKSLVSDQRQEIMQWQRHGSRYVLLFRRIM